MDCDIFRTPDTFELREHFGRASSTEYLDVRAITYDVQDNIKAVLTSPPVKNYPTNSVVPSVLGNCPRIL
jgi:hypothetical protein